MTHAIIILAHKNIPQVARLARYFEHDCDVFVHIDRKQQVDPAELALLKNLPQVRLVSRQYDVNWGGFSILECEIWLMQQVFVQSDAKYFHLISGQDYPVRPLTQFLDFFEEKKGKEFMLNIHLPNPGWEKNTFGRFQYYYPYDQAGDRPNPRHWASEQAKLQQDRGMKRPIPDEFDHLYGSSQWFSISRKAVKTLLDYTREKPSLYNRMWMTFAPEEAYLATVLVNLLGKECFANTNLRFIRWKHENGNRPANLGPEHFHYLLEHNVFFARKVEIPCSEALLNQIDKYLHRDDKIRPMPCGGWNYNGFLKYEFNPRFCSFVAQFCKEFPISSAIDMGCGAGIYVNAWCEAGLPFCGYDANPHTMELSRLLIPKEKEPCGVADLTDTLEVDNPFDLVICKDVLQYIPEGLREKAINNLALLSNRYILVTWDFESDKPVPTIEEFRSKLMLHGFHLNSNLTARLRSYTKVKTGGIFSRNT